jgi:hypothetical protein
MYYNQLCADKASMEGVSLNKRRQAQLLGVLFAEYEILTTEQASMIRDQMKKPQQVFANTDSLWAFYNFVTNSLQHSHPKTWMEDQRILHYFIGTICNFAPATASVVQVPDNQVVQEEVETESVLHQYEEEVEDVVEDTEVSFDIDADDDAVLGSILVPIENPGSVATVEDYLASKNEEEISPKNSLDIFPQDGEVIYTDAAGNTFEAPIVPEPDPEDDEDVPQMPAPEPENDAFEYEISTVIEADLNDLSQEVIQTEEKVDNTDFELDFITGNSDEEEKDETPDFF